MKPFSKKGDWERRSFAAFKRSFTNKEKLAIADEYIKAVYELMNRRKKK